MKSAGKILSLSLILILGSLHGADFCPLDIRNGATSSFRDELPEDGKGGWTDQGGCDMRMLPVGKLKVCGVDFQILPDLQTENKSCIVLGNMESRPHFRKRARVTLKALKSYPVLYLLHAGHWISPSSKPAGILRVEYTDGTHSSHNLRYRRDLLNWIGDENISAKNARKGWSIYNDSSQVSLFVSKIPLKRGQIVQSLEFQSGNNAWMIAGITLGRAVKVSGLVGDKKEIRRDYRIAEPVQAADWQKKVFPDKPRNVILIIGDGMGEGAIHAASYYGFGAKDRLVMSSLPVRSHCVTRSYGGKTTDSAAAGTALSGGYKTKNGMLGVNPDGTAFDSIGHEAKKAGMSVGLVTTDHLLGSTPAAFYTHVASRTFKAEIAASVLDCRFDILIGSPDRRYFLPPKSKGGINYMKRFEDAGYMLVSNYREYLKQDSANKVIGTFSMLGSVDALAKVTAKTVALLENNPKGFFIMVESGIPDQGGHSNNPDKTVFGTLCADHAVKAAVEYAVKRGNTLVIVTADHETGGVTAGNNPEDHRNVRITYSSGNHTDQNVPVYAYGPGAHLFAGDLDNTEIPGKIATLLGLPLGNRTGKLHTGETK